MRWSYIYVCSAYIIYRYKSKYIHHIRVEMGRVLGDTVVVQYHSTTVPQYQGTTAPKYNRTTPLDHALKVTRPQLGQMSGDNLSVSGYLFPNILYPSEPIEMFDWREAIVSDVSSSTCLYILPKLYYINIKLYSFPKRIPYPSSGGQKHLSKRQNFVREST